LLAILYQKDITKMFAFSNPDGYFYLLYLKRSLQFFVMTSLVSGSTIACVSYMNFDMH